MSDRTDKPTYSDLQRIESDYDPERDTLTDRVYGLLAIAERPRRNAVNRDFKRGAVL